MIKREDFQVEIGNTDDGATFVRIVHLPTGLERQADAIPNGQVGHVRDRLFRELKAELFNDDDFRFDIGRAVGGDFLRVTHIPSGKSQTTHPLGGRNLHEVEQDLMDSILEELARENEGHSHGRPRL